MAMAARIRRELGKSRELLWLLLADKVCFFCHKPILADGIPDYVKFGNATAPPLDLDVTWHHKNENHSDNRPRNLALSHESCHKSHHAKLVFAKWRQKAKRTMVGSCGARKRALDKWDPIHSPNGLPVLRRKAVA